MCTFYYKEQISQKCLRCLLHQSIFFCLFNSGLEPIPAVTLSTLWTDLQPTAGLTQRDRQPFALTLKPTADLESPFNLSYTCFWTERQENPERSLTIMGKLSTPHRKDPLTESEPQTFLVWSRAPKYRTTLPPPDFYWKYFKVN